MARAASVRAIREVCGCLSEPGGARWVALCRTHRAEFEQVHARARQDYQKRHARKKQS